MKNIKNYYANKYRTKIYERVEPHIYRTFTNNKYIYVTSLKFEQETKYGENETSSKYISRYPLEKIIEVYNCYCLDFYDNENDIDNIYSYQEFYSDNIENIQKLRELIGKHVYYKNDKLIIE